MKKTIDLSHIPVENLTCPHCHTVHEDIDTWAIKPHKTHFCLSCGEFFEGSIKAVSHPTLTPEFINNMEVEGNE